MRPGNGERQVVDDPGDLVGADDPLGVAAAASTRSMREPAEVEDDDLDDEARANGEPVDHPVRLQNFT